MGDALRVTGGMQPPDPWGFEEAPVETWADILAPGTWIWRC